MISQKSMLSILAVASLIIPASSCAMLGQVGRTAARYAGFGIGQIVGTAGVGLGTLVANLPKEQNYDNESTENLNAQGHLLTQSLSDQALTQKALDRMQQIKPGHVAAFHFSMILGMLVALSTRGAVRPVAVGFGTGAIGGSMLLHAHICDEPLKEDFRSFIGDAVQLAAIKKELKKRENKAE